MVFNWALASVGAAHALGDDRQLLVQLEQFPNQVGSQQKEQAPPITARNTNRARAAPQVRLMCWIRPESKKILLRFCATT